MRRKLTSRSIALNLKLATFIKRTQILRIRKNYFWLAVSEDFSKLIIQEPDMESLFGAKSEDERTATKELLSQWLIHTEAYKSN